MSSISILIVDDDIQKISAIISTINQTSNNLLFVKQASNVQEAIELLSKQEFHLLITDLQMPLKYDSLPDPRGGESLIKNMYRRKSKLFVPMYIVGLTQYSELQSKFEGVWKVWYFDMSSEEWQRRIKDLIFHISLVNSRISVNKLETIYVEGPTDKEIFLEALQLFYNSYLERVRIETRSYGGGASWVERQLVIWAKSLSLKPGENNYLKAVGLFDDDEAGRKAIQRLSTVIKENSAESKTISIVKCSSKFSPLLKSIRNKGLTFPTTLEELINIEVWKEAKKRNWLVPRNYNDYSIHSEILSISNSNISAETLNSHGFSEEEQLICLYKINERYKEEFKKLCLCFDIEKKKRNLNYISFVLKDIFDKLKFEPENREALRSKIL